METADVFKITKENVIISDYNNIVRFSNYTQQAVTPIINDKQLMALTKNQQPIIKVDDEFGNQKFVVIGPDFDELVRIIKADQNIRIKELEEELLAIRLDKALRKKLPWWKRFLRVFL